ncbi:hypothetical protein C2G38_2223353 [Gigaspora rosea]|uniref:Uncharacterized protein n=1 Tax=Gigaspora rosea TaxID=44941 RepID=A0A397U5P3_9GLOM|nr:hypothetical protein C2G38_2223353 [Gigaspora rosea]
MVYAYSFFSLSATKNDQVLAYVKDHEVHTQKKRMLAAEPRLRINLNPNIINIAAINNIDLKDLTFQYGNIFDVLVNLDDDIRNYPPFGISSIMEQCQTTIDWIFNQLINTGQTFNIEHINEAIKTNIDSILFVDPPNVVILKPGKAPSKDEHVHKAVDMFLEDFGYTEDGILNLVCNEAIYRRMKSYKRYRLFGIATQLGVKFLDKLEQVGYMKLHKLGIRIGNFDLKLHSLMAFAPLFHITRKYRYAESVARFITELRNEPQLLQNLRTVPSINLTQEGYYFAFDKALETFGIKFLKENMTGCATNLENLELNIKVAQTEYDRLNLLISEFTNDQSVSRSS